MVFKVVSIKEKKKKEELGKPWGGSRASSSKYWHVC